MKQVTTITPTLYKCREQQLFLVGEAGFIKLVNRWESEFKTVMEKFSCDVFEALNTLIYSAFNNMKNEKIGMLIHALNAVACELAQPTVAR